MHPALRKGPLFYRTPHFALFTNPHFISCHVTHDPVTTCRRVAAAAAGDTQLHVIQLSHCHSELLAG